MADREVIQAWRKIVQALYGLGYDIIVGDEMTIVANYLTNSEKNN